MSDPLFRCAVLTVSDRASRGEYEDKSGPALVAFINTKLGGLVAQTACIADEEDLIVQQFNDWIGLSPTIDLILSTGGTGLSPRDRTPEAAMRVIDRPHAGLMEMARHRTSEITELAYLSRGVAGAARGSLIVTLPGSPKGAVEQIEAIGSVLVHALKTLRGDRDLH
ncbi:MAG: MogA/MoaB family molybdenum cofactor biosynthesis protein [Phycisphaerales bacterium]|nr:MogA/MoaB family molybdenum cofactor biosynthesis protein [Phycisphaerales bacterium]